jgi:diketogulonate reductase-like aldo/keto reductase
MPAFGFGALIPGEADTNATRTALQVGFRHFDCSERYRNEQQVGHSIREAIQTERINRSDLFITTKLWNNNHRPERVQPAIAALYLMHTCYAFRSGDDQDARDKDDRVIYDEATTLMDTLRAMENS